MTTGRGLSGVPRPALEQLLAAVERGRLECPFGAADVAEAGFLGSGDDVVDALRGVDRAGVLAALRIAIAEREHRPPPRLDLVWTGPETRASICLGTAQAVERLFSEARRTVVVCGYRFDDPDILRPLHAAMRDRGLQVTLFVDIPSEASAADADTFACSCIDRFWRDVWTFGTPKPDVFYDPTSAVRGPPWVSLHAKCIVVDDERSLVTSANFTDRGQTRNIEAGVLIDDRRFAEDLAAQWRQLIVEGVVKKYVG